MSVDTHGVTLPQGVSLVVEDERGLLLVVTRPDGVGMGLPGGKVDPGETLAEAAVRELAEETGLRVTASDMKPLLQDVCPSEVDYDVTVFVVKKAALYGQSVEQKEPRVMPFWTTWEAFCASPPFAGFNTKIAAVMQNRQELSRLNSTMGRMGG